MRVLKFGGTSIGTVENIRTVIQIVREKPVGGRLLVFSAVGRTTDELDEIGKLAASGRLDESWTRAAALRDAHLALSRALLPGGKRLWRLETLLEKFHASLQDVTRSLSILADCSPAARDRLLGMGEILSSQVLCEALAHEGIPTEWVDARDVVVTDDRHTCAEPLFQETADRCRERIAPLLGRGLVPVTQGFIARSASGAATTLGRGGSDYSASLLGAALDAEEIEIWTDVDGIMTADPCLVPQARRIPVLSFQEASELAFFGARVLHPQTLQPAIERGIPVRVLNTLRPGSPGTLILAQRPSDAWPVQSIAYKEDVVLLSLVSARMFKAHGFMRRLFDILDRRGLSPDGSAASEVSVALALHDPPELDALAREIGELGRVDVRRNQAIVCVVGEGLKEEPGVVKRVFEDLHDVRVSLVFHGGSAINLGFVVDEADLPRVVRRLHGRFFERPPLGSVPWDTEGYGPPAIL